MNSPDAGKPPTGPQRSHARDPSPPVSFAQQLAFLVTLALFPAAFFVSWRVWIGIGGVLAVLAAIARVAGCHDLARAFLTPLLGAILLPLTVIVCFYMVCVVK